jgi:hypothetical protein
MNTEKAPPERIWLCPQNYEAATACCHPSDTEYVRADLASSPAAEAKSEISGSIDYESIVNALALLLRCDPSYIVQQVRMLLERQEEAAKRFQTITSTAEFPTTTVIAAREAAERAAREIIKWFGERYGFTTKDYHVEFVRDAILKHCFLVSGDVISKAEPYATELAIGKDWLAYKEPAQRIVERIADNDCLTCQHWSADAVYAIAVELATAARTLPIVQAIAADGEAMRRACIQKVKEAWATRHATLEEIIAALEAIEVKGEKQ